MAGYVALYAEGVLAAPDSSSFAASKLIPQGQVLYHALRNVEKLLVFTEHDHVDRVHHWLRSHGFTHHAALITNVMHTDDPQRRRNEMIETARGMGALDMLITGDPEIAAHALHVGVVPLLVSVPEYTRPEFRPGAERTGRPWDVIVAELEDQRSLKAEDDRVTADVAGTRFLDD